MRVSRAVVCLFVFVFAVNAFADAARTWVSGTGDDVNPCTFTAPCRTFAGAYVKTLAGGQISVKDVGSFGGLTIHKSITIEGGGEFASVQFSSGNAITIDLTGNDGSNTVVLRGLKIFSTSGSGYGVFVTGTVPTHVHVVDTTFTNSSTAVSMFPGAAGSSLSVENVEASSLELAGFLIGPPAGTPLKLTMNNVRVSQSAPYSPWAGVRVYSNTTGTISNSSFRNGFHGIAVENANVRLNVVRTVLSDNFGGGLQHNSAGITTVLDGCSIFGNATGISNVGGTVIGFTNNAVLNNQQEIAGNPVQSLLAK
jgi:hypothetical protein